MQDAAVTHSSHVGGTKQLYETLNVTWVARSHHIDYVQPARAGDTVIAHTWIADKRKVRCRRKYKFTRASEQSVLARAETEWVYVDLQSGRPRAIHCEVINRFPIVSVDDEP